MSHHLSITNANSFLFVPADRPERFEKAIASGANYVIVDLEDAIVDGNKATARKTLEEHLPLSQDVIIRINSSKTEWFEDDCKLLKRPGICGIMLPKAERAEELSKFSLPLIPLVETAVGMGNLSELAACSNVVRLAFGAIDFMLDLGFSEDNGKLLPFRTEMVMRSRIAEIGSPIDGITQSINDTDQMRTETQYALSCGFGARLCIHPNQVKIIEQMYCPTPEQVSWACEIISHMKTGSFGALQLDGQMIDKPLIEKAKRVLAQSELKKKM